VPGSVRAALALLALALASALVVAPVPTYDPWAWLLWGREVAGGGLSTAEGPAFKPLPVAVCAVLAPLGAAAPWLWVLLARAAALAAVWAAYRLGRRLGGSAVAGGLAAAGVALCGGYALYAATGLTEGALLALALGGLEAWRAGRRRLALACAVACALLRVETWPFLFVAALAHLRRRPADAPLLAGLAAAGAAAWIVPEWLGSGDPLRSGTRARIPNPGQPALADVPALASLGAAAALPMWPLWAGVAWLGIRQLAAGRGDRARAATSAGRAALPGMRRGAGGGDRARAATSAGGGRPAPAAVGGASALAVAAAGGAWIVLVAVMAQAGFSGEPRYALPGAALVAVAGAVGLFDAARALAVRAPRAAWAGPALAVAVVAVAAAPRLAEWPRLRSAQSYQAGLAADLADAIRAAGGREGVLACGRPYTGRYRGPLTAYRLDVAKRVVGFEPRAPGVIFRSRLAARSRPAPAVPPGFAPLAGTGRWQVFTACRLRSP
jgi:hypothetical protein